MDSRQAEIVAIRAVEWISADRHRFADFWRLTGVTPDDARTQMEDPDFLASVMDFLLMSDERVSAFCEVTRLPMHVPMQARQSLPGGDLPNWT